MAAAGLTDERLDRYAELLVRVGANLRPGQLVDITARVEHAPLARALARTSYAAGAAFVDVYYSDQHVRRAMIESAPDEALSFTPRWLLTRVRELGDARSAAFGITGDPEPELLADLDGQRVGKARMIDLAHEGMRIINEQLVNWCVAACPNEGWARTIFGEPDVERLWELVAYCIRLDEPDPLQAWRDHIERLKARVRLLDEARLDALRFRGPGTDLTVGLHENHRWIGAESVTADGLPYVANMPTEEVFTTPDARRTSGVVRSTRPLPLYGNVVRGLELAFEEGRIVDVRADAGAEVVHGQLATDERAPFLGEVALVDGTSRIGETGIVYFDPPPATSPTARRTPRRWTASPATASTSRRCTRTSWSGDPTSTSTASRRRGARCPSSVTTSGS